MMITGFAFWILLIFGVVTGLLAVQFLFPKWYSRSFNGIKIDTGAESFYARQGGLAISIQGALLIWSAFDPSVRTVSLVLVGIGKLLFVSYLWINISKLKGLAMTAIIDSLAVMLFAALLLKL